MNLQRLSILATELNLYLAFVSFNTSKLPQLIDCLRRLRDEINTALPENERKELAA